MIKTPIDQINLELIFALIQCPKWHPVNYVVGGIYDRCVENFKSHKDDDVLTDHEKYDWVCVPTSSKIHTIWLAKPGKKVERKYKLINTKTGYHEREVWTNVVRLDLFLYRSITHKNVQGFTFGDRSKILKPLKILEHSWVVKKTESWKDFSSFGLTSKETCWVCSNCGLHGVSKSSTASVVFPDKLITCDEATVADIII
jgi:hypothetical protein